jgi:DNA-binding transcriptional MerR regulator
VTLNVSDIAERIAKPGMDKAAIVERIRHWTREGLLQPAGEKNPGTGRRRRYDGAALADAVVLNELAGLGFQVNLLRTILILVKDAKNDWREKAKQGVNLYLEIDMLPDGARFPHYHEGCWFNPNAELVLILNLTQLFERLEKKGG